MRSKQFEKGVVLVDLETTKKVDNQNGHKWVTMDEFVKTAPKEQVDYYAFQILCCGLLCVGRNNVAIEMVAEMYPYDMCYAVCGSLFENYDYLDFSNLQRT